MSECMHTGNLHWGSGGYYIWCTKCTAYWVATKGGDDKPDPKRGEQMLDGTIYRATPSQES